MVDIAQLEIRVKSLEADKAARDLNRLEKGARESERATKRLGDQADRSGRRIRGMGQNVAGASRTILALVGTFASFNAIRNATRLIADFEQTMVTVKAVTGASDAEFQRLQATARQLGATTKFSAKESGEGLLFLARAGFEVNQAIQALPSTLDLAAAGGLGLGEASDIASNALSQFRLEATETSRVVDALVTVSNSANTDVRQLAEALNYAGPVAGALKIEIEETAASLGVLGDSGIQASSAGTNLRGIMSTLLGPTAKAREAIEGLGLSLDDVDPSVNGIQESFKRFRDAGLGAAEASAIFGNRNFGAALILAQSADKIENLTQKTIEARGAGKELAKEMNDNLAGSLKALRSAFEEAILAGGDAGFAKTLRDLVDESTAGIRILLGVANTATRVSEEGQKAAVAIENIAKALIALTALRAAGWFFALAGSMGSVLGAVGLVTTGIVGLAYWLNETEDAAERARRELELLKSIPDDTQVAAMESFAEITERIAKSSKEAYSAFASNQTDAGLEALERGIAARTEAIAALRAEIAGLSTEVSGKFIEGFAGFEDRIKTQLQVAIVNLEAYITKLRELRDQQFGAGEPTTLTDLLQTANQQKLEEFQSILKRFDSLSFQSIEELASKVGEIPVPIDDATKALQRLIDAQERQIESERATIEEIKKTREERLQLNKEEQEASGTLQSLITEYEKEVAAIKNTAEELKELDADQRIASASAILLKSANQENVKYAQELLNTLQGLRREVKQLTADGQAQELAEKALSATLRGALSIYDRIGAGIRQTGVVRAKQREEIYELIKAETRHLQTVQQEGQSLTLFQRIERSARLEREIRRKGTALLSSEVERFINIAKQEAAQVQESVRSRSRFNQTLEKSKRAIGDVSTAIGDWFDRSVKSGKQIERANKAQNELIENLRREREEVGLTADAVERLALLRTLAQQGAPGEDATDRAKRYADALRELALTQQARKAFKDSEDAKERAKKLDADIAEGERRNADEVTRAREARAKARRDLTEMAESLRRERLALDGGSNALRDQDQIRRAYAIGVSLSTRELEQYIEAIRNEQREMNAAQKYLDDRAKKFEALKKQADDSKRIAKEREEAEKRNIDLAEKSTQAFLRQIEAIKRQRLELTESNKEKERSRLGAALESTPRGAGLIPTIILQGAAAAEQVKLEDQKRTIEELEGIKERALRSAEDLAAATDADYERRSRLAASQEEERNAIEAKISTIEKETGLLKLNERDREIQLELIAAAKEATSLEKAELDKYLASLEAVLGAREKAKQTIEDSNSAIERAIQMGEDLNKATEDDYQRRVKADEAARAAEQSVRSMIDAIVLERKELGLTSQERERSNTLREAEKALLGVDAGIRAALLSILRQELDLYDEKKKSLEDQDDVIKRAIANADALIKATEDWNDVTNKVLDSQDKLTDQLKDLDHQIDKLANGDAAEVAKFQAEAMAAYQENTVAAAAATDAFAAKLRRLRQLENITQFADDFANAIGDAFESAIIDGEKLRDVFRGLAKDISRALLQLLVIRPLTSAIGAGVSSGLGALTGGDGLFSGIVPSAKGNVFSGGRLIPFADGGIIQRNEQGISLGSIFGFLGGFGVGPGGSAYGPLGGLLQLLGGFYNVTPFGNGGIFDSPHIFPMKDGAGVLGEAGPEAILPLRRGRGGRLGVEASGMGFGAGVSANMVSNTTNKTTVHQTVYFTVRSDNPSTFRRAERSMRNAASRILSPSKG